MVENGGNVDVVEADESRPVTWHGVRVSVSVAGAAWCWTLGL